MSDFDNAILRPGASALIPVQYSQEIIQEMPKNSVALTLFRRYTMSTKQLRMPVLTALPYAYFPGGDTGLKKTTKAEWEGQFLEAETLACIVPVPEEVLEDSQFDIWAQITPLVREAMGAVLDAAVLFGTNKPTSWGEAVVPMALAAGNYFVKGSDAGKDLAHDISEVMRKVENDGYDVNGFLGSTDMKANLRDLRDGEGRLLFQPSLQAGTPGTLYAQPIEYIRNGAWDATDTDLIAGDMMKAIIGLRSDITVKWLTESIIQDESGATIFNLSQQDMVALRVRMRVAYQTVKPVTRQNGTEGTRCPFAYLKKTA